jgi:FtsP/CotA-like multicopper oxidase with cupredoxin domain
MTGMSNEDRSVLSWLSFAVAVGALVMALFGLRDSGSSESAAGTGGGARPTIDVVMKDFAFEPATITIPTGGAIIHLMNAGAAVHNLQVPDLGIKSADVAAGATLDLEIGAQSTGTYKVICPQPGHEGAGMVGALVVSESATGGESSSGGQTSTGGEASNHGGVSWHEMDANMLARAQLYPAKTAGEGGLRMEPTMAADGYKEFVIEAKIVDWEVEPGKIVKAWTYNGVVPAPQIQVYSGDKVRLILKNNLPDSTSLHLHGIQVPNVMDGVDPYTELPTPPGGEHVYEFVAKGPAVGIYHSHHNAEQQIPDGMFGALLIDEIGLPQKLIDKGYDPAKITKRVDMVLNDAGVIGLSLNGKSFPATKPYTLRVGQIMIVNYLNEGLMAHPMHMHQPLGWVIAKDGVPLDEPQPTDTINVAPGERYTVAYMGQEPGVWAWHCHILTHAETPEGMRYMVTALIVER